MAVSVYYHGKAGGFTVGTSTTVGIKSWEATHSVVEHATTATTSGGYGEVQGGIETVEGSIEASYDTTSGPYTLLFVPGTYVADLHLKVNTSDATSAFTITSAFIKSVSPKMDANDIVTYKVDFRSHGSFTKPTK
jgi:hypothetical protein